MDQLKDQMFLTAESNFTFNLQNSSRLSQQQSPSTNQQATANQPQTINSIDVSEKRTIRSSDTKTNSEIDSTKKFASYEEDLQQPSSNAPSNFRCSFEEEKQRGEGGGGDSSQLLQAIQVVTQNPNDTFALDVQEVPKKGLLLIEEQKKSFESQHEQSEYVTPQQNFQDPIQGGYFKSPLQDIQSDQIQTPQRSFQSHLTITQLKRKKNDKVVHQFVEEQQSSQQTVTYQQNQRESQSTLSFQISKSQNLQFSNRTPIINRQSKPDHLPFEAQMSPINTQSVFQEDNGSQMEVVLEGKSQKHKNITLRKMSFQEEQHPLSPNPKFQQQRDLMISSSASSANIVTPSPVKPQIIKSMSTNQEMMPHYRRKSLNIQEYLKLTKQISADSPKGVKPEPTKKNTPKSKFNTKLQKASSNPQAKKKKAPLIIERIEQAKQIQHEKKQKEHYAMNSLREMEIYRKDQDSDGPEEHSLSPPQGRGEQEKSRIISSTQQSEQDKYQTRNNLFTQEDDFNQSEEPSYSDVTSSITGGSPGINLKAINNNLERVIQVEEQFFNSAQKLNPRKKSKSLEDFKQFCKQDEKHSQILKQQNQQSNQKRQKICMDLHLPKNKSQLSSIPQIPKDINQFRRHSENLSNNSIPDRNHLISKSTFHVKNFSQIDQSSQDSLFNDPTSNQIKFPATSRISSALSIDSQTSTIDQVQNRLEQIELKRQNMKHIEQAIILFNSGQTKKAFAYMEKVGMIAEAQPEKDPKQLNQFEEEKKVQQPALGAKKMETTQHHDDIAKFLYHIKGLDKQIIGDVLGKNTPFAEKLRMSYTRVFQFGSMQFDKAFRMFLSKTRLPKQSQQIERMLEAFSHQYFLQNRDKLPSQDQTFTLAYSLLLLNVDLHSPNIPKNRKMTKHQFVRNNRQCCATLPQNYLEFMYDRICERPLQTKIDDTETAYKRLGLVHKKQDGGQNLGEEMNKKSIGFDPRDAAAGAQIKRQSLVESQFNRGSYFTKYGRYGNPHKKLVRMTPDYKKIQWFAIDESGHPTGQQKHINIKDVEQVLVGSTHTKVFKKHNIPKEMDNCCISIIAEKRTLDLRHQNADVVKKWYSELITKFNQFSKSKEDELMEAKIANYSALQVKQAIYEIWSSEILVNWSKYWSSSKREPKNIHLVLNLSSVQLKRITKVGAAVAIAHGQQVQKKIKTSIARELSTTFQALWLQGIPTPIRKVIWPIVIQNSLKITERLYKLLVLQSTQANSLVAGISQLNASASNSLNDKNNSSDNFSSFSFNMSPSQRRMETQIFRCVQNSKLADKQMLHENLTTLLQTFFQYRQDLLYINGMADIALLFLTNLQNQYSAFTCFINMMHQGYFMYYFSSDMSEINWRLQYFEDLFQIELPKLHNHFKTLEFTPDMYLLDWYLNLFGSVLPQFVTLRVWDGFFLRGQIYVIQVALALLKYIEPKVKFSSMKNICQVLKNLREQESLFNEQLFFQLVADTKVSRKQFEDRLQKQKQAQEKAQVLRYFIE